MSLNSINTNVGAMVALQSLNMTNKPRWRWRRTRSPPA